MFKKICFIFCLVTFSSFGQNKICEDYRVGEFIYPNNPNKLSVRKESTQESYIDGKLVMLWKVNWINDCTYEIICEKVLDETLPIQVGDRIVTTILETDSKCYQFSLVYYNSEFPNGLQVPNGGMCKK